MKSSLIISVNYSDQFFLFVQIILKKTQLQFILHHGDKGFLRNSIQKKDDLLLFNGTGGWRIVVCIHPCSDRPKDLGSHLWVQRSPILGFLELWHGTGH